MLCSKEEYQRARAQYFEILQKEWYTKRAEYDKKEKERIDKGKKPTDFGIVARNGRQQFRDTFVKYHPEVPKKYVTDEMEYFVAEWFVDRQLRVMKAFHDIRGEDDVATVVDKVTSVWDDKTVVKVAYEKASKRRRDEEMDLDDIENTIMEIAEPIRKKRAPTPPTPSVPAVVNPPPAVVNPPSANAVVAANRTNAQRPKRERKPARKENYTIKELEENAQKMLDGTEWRKEFPRVVTFFDMIEETEKQLREGSLDLTGIISTIEANGTYHVDMHLSNRHDPNQLADQILKVEDDVTTLGVFHVALRLHLAELFVQTNSLGIEPIKAAVLRTSNGLDDRNAIKKYEILYTFVHGMLGFEWHPSNGRVAKKSPPPTTYAGVGYGMLLVKDLWSKEKKKQATDLKQLTYREIQQLFAYYQFRREQSREDPLEKMREAGELLKNALKFDRQVTPFDARRTRELKSTPELRMWPKSQLSDEFIDPADDDSLPGPSRTRSPSVSSVSSSSSVSSASSSSSVSSTNSGSSDDGSE